MDESFENLREECAEYMSNKFDTFLSQWCEEAGVKDPIGYKQDHNGCLIIYTNHPGSLIGKGGSLFYKYEAIMKEEFPHLTKINLVEIDGFAHTH